MTKKKARQVLRREQRLRAEPVKLMFAFGSNLNHAQMKMRCPDAVPFRKLYLPDGRLTFRQVADAEYCPGSVLPGGLWRITPACERAMDMYEGVLSGVYRKKYLKVRVLSENGGKPQRVLYYKMNDKSVMPPTVEYIDRIAQGYRDFGLDLAYLDEALARSWEEKAPSRFLRERHKARGSPFLAQPEPVLWEEEEEVVEDKA